MDKCYDIMILADPEKGKWITFKGYRYVDGTLSPCTADQAERLLRTVLTLVADVKYDIGSIELRLKSGAKIVLSAGGDWTPYIDVYVL